MSHKPEAERFDDHAPDAEHSPACRSDSEHNELAHRLEFLKLTETDAERLRELRPVFESFATKFVEEFYRHLFSFETTASFFHDPELVERLKAVQCEHFRSMFEARWNDEFVARRHRVGHAHATAGVEPQFFLGAYTQFLEAYLRHVDLEERESGNRRQVAEDDSPQASTTRHSPHPVRHLDLLSLLRAVFLDVGLTLDAWFQQSTNDLRQALDMLWKANAELRQFAHFTSHDLKTPLATAANLCEEALDEFGDRMPEEARGLVESARQTVFRMSGMIDELLSVSLAAGREPLEQDVASEEVLTEAVDRVRPLLENKRIELRIAGPLPRVRAHRIHLREVFYNLLANAAKYLDKQPGRIDFATEPGDGHFTFSICDNGPGIPAEELERIFAPFRRLPAHRHLPGSGLGLYFTRMLLERHGGRVWAESTPGEGSCFFVRLAVSSPPAAG